MTAQTTLVYILSRNSTFSKVMFNSEHYFNQNLSFKGNIGKKATLLQQNCNHYNLSVGQ